MKSHISGQAGIKKYLSSFLNNNGKFLITKLWERKKSCDNSRNQWHINSKKGIELFCRENFYIESNFMSQNENMWNIEIESPFFHFSNMFREIVKRDVYKQKLTDELYKKNIRKYSMESLVIEKVDIIINYFLLCWQRELIRLDPDDAELHFNIIESTKVEKKKIENNEHDCVNLKLSKKENYLKSIYIDLKLNFNILIWDSYSTYDLLLDSPIIMNDNCVIFLQQGFGSLIFIRKGWSLTNDFEIIKNSSEHDNFFTFKNIKSIKIRNKICELFQNHSNSTFNIAVYKINFNNY